jgi:hypothetical protein
MSEIVEKVAAVEVKCMSPFGLTIASVNYWIRNWTYMGLMILGRPKNFQLNPHYPSLFLLIY